MKYVRRVVDLQVWPEPCKHLFQPTGNSKYYCIIISQLYFKIVFSNFLLNNPSLKTGELERRVDLEQDELLIKLGLVHIQGEYCGQVHIVFSVCFFLSSSFFTLPHSYSGHRVHTEWQRPLSSVHSIMIEKLAQAGEGGECTPTSLSLYLPSRTKLHCTLQLNG
jgi:hypothetical protein